MFIQGNMEKINNFLKVISKGSNYNDLSKLQTSDGTLHP